MVRWCGGICWALLCLLYFNRAQAQTPQYAFRIYLKDKTGAPPLSASPSFLSARSLNRRIAQAIPVDELDRPVSSTYINDILTSTTGKLHLSSRWLNTCVILLNDSANILSLQGKTYIDSIKYIAHYSNTLHNLVPLPPDNSSEQLPYDAQMKTTGTAAYYGATFGQTQLVNGDYLHDRDYRGEGKLIAVLDNGFAGVNTMDGFDSLNNAGKLLDQFNFVKHNTDVFSGSYNHGTSALSTMAANMPGNYVGTAPNAEYAVYVTEDDANGEMEIELDNLLAGTERADSIGADIISVSLGYNTFSVPFTGLSYTYADLDGKKTIAAKAANIATTKGMLFVASAGNEGSGTWHYILTPGDADSAITIGSVDLKGIVAASSSYGPNAAGRIKPDVCMVGNAAMVLTTGNNPVAIGGTSFALPQLAGWAACLWQTKPTATPFMIKNAIIRSASKYTTPNNHEGYGIPDLKIALQYLDVKDTPVVPTLANLVTVGPNPFNNAIDVKVYHTKTGDILLRIVNINGKEVYQNKYTRLAGIHHLPVSIASSLVQAVFYLTVISSGNTVTIPIVKN
jgi:serine protease AprX